MGCHIGSTVLLVVCCLQLISTVERLVFDFMGFMYTSMILNILHILLVTIAIFGVCTFRNKMILAYAIWCGIFLTWNTFVVCVYLKVGSLDAQLAKNALSFGLSKSWWLSTDAVNDGEAAEVGHAAVQCVLSVLGCTSAVYLTCMLMKEDATESPFLAISKIAPPPSARSSVRSNHDRAQTTTRQTTLQSRVSQLEGAVDGRDSLRSNKSNRSQSRRKERPNSTYHSDEERRDKTSDSHRSRRSTRSGGTSKESRDRSSSARRRLELGEGTSSQPWVSVVPSSFQDSDSARSPRTPEHTETSLNDLGHENASYGYGSSTPDIPPYVAARGLVGPGPPPPISEGPGPYTERLYGRLPLQGDVHLQRDELTQRNRGEYSRLARDHSRQHPTENGLPINNVVSLESKQTASRKSLQPLDVKPSHMSDSSVPSSPSDVSSVYSKKDLSPSNHPALVVAHPSNPASHYAAVSKDRPYGHPLDRYSGIGLSSASSNPAFGASRTAEVPSNVANRQPGLYSPSQEKSLVNAIPAAGQGSHIRPPPSAFSNSNPGYINTTQENRVDIIANGFPLKTKSHGMEGSNVSRTINDGIVGHKNDKLEDRLPAASIPLRKSPFTQSSTESDRSVHSRQPPPESMFQSSYATAEQPTAYEGSRQQASQHSRQNQEMRLGNAGLTNGDASHNYTRGLPMNSPSANGQAQSASDHHSVAGLRQKPVGHESKSSAYDVQYTAKNNQFASHSLNPGRVSVSEPKSSAEPQLTEITSKYGGLYSSKQSPVPRRQSFGRGARTNAHEQSNNHKGLQDPYLSTVGQSSIAQEPDRKPNHYVSATPLVI